MLIPPMCIKLHHNNRDTLCQLSSARHCHMAPKPTQPAWHHVGWHQWWLQPLVVARESVRWRQPKDGDWVHVQLSFQCKFSLARHAEW